MYTLRLNLFGDVAFAIDAGMPACRDPWIGARAALDVAGVRHGRVVRPAAVAWTG
ncbi:MAG TPA: hypothetical protein PKC03_06670 [Dokdonella sp.]|nr:hypothetical protein [Dokdonella sp.]